MTTRGSARFGALPNTGRGRRRSCSTRGGSPRSSARLPVRRPRACSARQRCRTSSSLTSYTTTLRRPGPRYRSPAVIRRRYFKSANGGGAPASQPWPRSPPVPSRRRCLSYLATPRCWTSWLATALGASGLPWFPSTFLVATDPSAQAGRATNAGRQRSHLQPGLPRLGANASGREADQRHGGAARHQSEGSDREASREKQPSLDFASPSQLGGTVAFLCSAAADQIA